MIIPLKNIKTFEKTSRVPIRKLITTTTEQLLLYLRTIWKSKKKILFFVTAVVYFQGYLKSCYQVSGSESLSVILRGTKT